MYHTVQERLSSKLTTRERRWGDHIRSQITDAFKLFLRHFIGAMQTTEWKQFSLSITCPYKSWCAIEQKLTAWYHMLRHKYIFILFVCLFLENVALDTYSQWSFVESIWVQHLQHLSPLKQHFLIYKLHKLQKQTHKMNY